jgi:predicted enzyme related to lactoylglutathione lyase
MKIMKKKSPVVHFEMPAKDRQRMADFYAKVFGWEPRMFGEDMGNYVTVSTTDTDEQGRPKNPGAINGGLYPITPDMPEQYPSLVISVDDINTSIRDLKAAGAQILGEPVDIPQVGRWVSFVDTEGNRNSILQPGME